MEVETRPPLVDGQLGLRSSSSCGDNLSLRLADDLLLGDVDRELLKSPLDEELLLMDDLVDAACNKGSNMVDIVDGVVSKKNGEVISEFVTNPGDVFRTGVDKNGGCEPPVGVSAKIAEATESSNLLDSTSSLSDANVENLEIEESTSNGASQYDEVHSSELVIEDPSSIEDLKLSGGCDSGDGLLQDFTTELHGNSGSPNVCQGSQEDGVSVQDGSTVSTLKVQNVCDSAAPDSFTHDECGSSSVHNEEKTEENENNTSNVPDENMVGEEGFPEITENILPIIESESDDDMDNEDINSNEEGESDMTRDILPVDITESTVQESADRNKISEKMGDGKSELQLTGNEGIFPSRSNLKRRVSSDEVGVESCSSLLKKRRRNSVGSDMKAIDVSQSFESLKKLKRSTADIAELKPTNLDRDSSTKKPSEKTEDVQSVVNNGLNSDEASSSDSIHGPHDKNSIMILDSDDEETEVNKSLDSIDSEKENQNHLDNQPTAPKSALDMLFNGRKEITLNRKMFSKIMKSYVSQYLMTYGEFGKATALTLKAETMMSKLQSAAANYEKQREESRLVMKKLVEDRQAYKKWDETIIPQKMTRSVGLQVCTVGSYNVKNAMGDKAERFSLRKGRPGPYEYSTTVTMQVDTYEQQKEALTDQQKSLVPRRKIVNNQQLGVGNSVISRPTAKKSVTSLPNSRIMHQRKSTVDNVPTIPQFSKIVPRFNGMPGKTLTPVSQQNTVNKVVHLVKSPQPSLNSTLQTSPTSNLNVRGGVSTLQKNSSQKAMMIPSKVLQIPSQLIATSKPVANSALLGTGSIQQQVKKAFSSGPGRPAVTVTAAPPTIVNALASAISTSRSNQELVIQMNAPATTLEKVQQKKSTGPPSLEATIDLTDLDDDVPTSAKPTTNHLGSALTGKQLSPLKTTMKASAGGTQASKVIRYPPLPSNPANFNPATAPPKPHLGICDSQTVTQGIMLTWHFSNVQPLRKIVKFQVYAYQESKGDSEDSWKKVGDVDALPLPMACTLTQFREGYTYHFIVRAVDDCGDPGPFSTPSTITLVKKM